MFDVILANWVLLTVSFILGWMTVDRFRYKKLSEKDLFTDCFNKDWAITRKNSKLVRMMKYTDKIGVPFGLMFIDFDDFKQVNNEKGHEHGDEVILNIVSVIKRKLEKKGIMVRFGGDELMVLIPNTHIEELKGFCENLCWVIKQNVDHTVSIGGTIFNRGDAINVKELINKADANVYAAKEKGKDCAVVA
jgi:diguanylate cyclase (GGDEF)-like protein